MERVYTYKFRIYPNKKQGIYLANVFGCCRLVYNYFLDEKKQQYEKTKTSDSYNVQSGKLTELRKNNSFEFLKNAPLQSLQCSLRNMHTAYDNFYKHKSSYPKFKNRRGKQSFKIAQPNTFHIKNSKLFIPKLKSGIDIVMNREIVGKVYFATISKNKADRYHITITVKQDYEPCKKTNRSVGLDLGIKDFVITSDGVKYKNHRSIIRTLKCKLKHNQRHLSRKVYGSRRYENQVLKCNRIYQKITDVKTDYIHKITNELVNNYDVIKVEDLNIKGMMKNHKLAEAISECNWYQFIQTLEYKCLWNDKTLIKIDRYYPSSQMCSECGYVERKVRNLNVREWTCCHCGCHHDRDVNAARNILKYNSVRNAENNRGVVCKPFARPKKTGERTDNCEATIELLQE
jgi:putative transposase